MQEAFVNVNNIPTHVMTWGKWIEESLDDIKEVVLCITGNPGLPGYYTKFMSTIHNNLDPNVPVWVIGHGGHDEPPESSIRKIPPLSGNEINFSLEAQIKHKIAFIEQYIPKHIKIHLIGHSIGAWIILQLLKQQPQLKQQVQKSYMLFPTIERMRETSNGWYFTNLCIPFMPIINLLLVLLNKFPVTFKIFLIYLYFWVFSIPTFFIGTTLKYMKPSVVQRVVYMAKDEMDAVKELDIDGVRENKHLLKFYYGTTDGWVPVKYYHEIKEKIPDLDAILDDKKISHAFILRSSREMGEIVSNWIKEFSVSSSKI